MNSVIFFTNTGFISQLAYRTESEWFTGDTPKWMRQEGNQALALTRDANLDTQSSDISAEEIRESGRSFQSLIACVNYFCMLLC